MDAAQRRRLDEQLRRLADGDRAAFEPVYELAWPVVRGFCIRALGPDGEDAAQEALVKVFARASEYDPDRSALPWIVGIAAWECRSIRRRSARRGRHIEVGPEMTAATIDPEAELLEIETVRAAAGALDVLRPDEVEMLLAAYSGDRDAACRQGVSPATFRKRVERALARVRAAWRSTT